MTDLTAHARRLLNTSWLSSDRTKLVAKAEQCLGVNLL